MKKISKFDAFHISSQPIRVNLSFNSIQWTSVYAESCELIFKSENSAQLFIFRYEFCWLSIAHKASACVQSLYKLQTIRTFSHAKFMQ